MKKRSFLLAGLAALFMASCSDNDLNQEDKIIEKDANLYMRVSIANPSGQLGRAAESGYEFGSEDEMAISKILFVFYDKDENYVGNTTMNSTDFIKTTPGSDGSQIDVVADLVIPVELKAGVGVPYYAMAYVNPTTSKTTSTDQVSSLETAKTLLRSWNEIIPKKQGGLNENGFTMSNSVYYAAEETNTPVSIAAVIPDGALFEEKKDAEESETKLTIYVERLAAKVSVKQNANIKETNNTVADGDDTKVLKFVPLAWGVNNVEKTTFLIKNFRQGQNVSRNENTGVSSITALTNLNYGAANTGIQDKETSFSWDWNLPNHFRSFWACSPTYFTGGKYPATASDYKGNSSSYDLVYRSYDDFWNTTVTPAAVGKWGQSFGDDKCLYTLENTCWDEVLTNQAQRALSSVVVVGQYYVLSNESESIEGKTPETFYLRRTTDKNYYYSESDIQTKFITANTIIGKKEGSGDGARFVPSQKWTTDFEINHPGKEVTGTYNAPSRYVTLMLKAEQIGKGYWYQNENGQEIEITSQATLNAANARLYNTLAAQDLGGIIQFTNGMAYFNVPIKHERTGEASTDGNYAAALTGEYGVVRNHLYALTVTGIDGIGIGIRDPEDPIIVPVEEQTYYVYTQLNVLAWRLEKNNVVLKN